MNSIRLAALLACAFAACSSPAAPFRRSSTFDEPPPDFAGFPPQTLQGIVFAQARWASDHADFFGVDLIERAHVVPVALTVRLRGQGQSEAQVLLNPERMDAVLYLEDGASLRAIGVEDVLARLPERHASKLRKSALKTGLVSTADEEGFLFFALEPEQSFKVDGSRIVHAAGAESRTLSLGASLLSFNVGVDGASKPFYVGLEH